MGSARDAVLVVDDDVPIGRVLVALLEQRGLQALHVPSAEEAIAKLEARPWDLVLSDVRMPGMDGMALLDHTTLRYPGVPVVLLTAHGSVELAVDAMKRGAADFVRKPFEKDEIAFVVEKALAGSRPARAAPPASPGGTAIVGESPVMRDVATMIRKVAASNSTVLVRGETGTGKELVARAIHDEGARKPQPFVSVHCASLPETLLESELFGYEKGAFTGATQRKPGRVELAHKGTLFLDEIGDISPAVQVKLLRVIQERELQRVGGTQTIRVDVRFIAATHRDLEAMVRAGEFREDLFYRLSVVPITIPPLRERGEDCARLVRHFVAELAVACGRPHVRLDDASVALLATQPWPGNVRQLQNFVERLVVLADKDEIRAADVVQELGARPKIASGELSLDAQRKETEREAIVSALSRASNNRTRAARLLEVSRRTFYNKLREHGLE